MNVRDEPDPARWPGLIERPARGPGDWPTGVWAVLVHGTMDRGAGMAHVARHLRDAPTLRYDRRGYGRSVGMGTGGLVRHIDDLIAIVGSRPVVLFGHSFGGLVVLGAAATGRLDIRGLATWETPTPWIPGWTGWRLKDPGKVKDRAGVMAEQFMRDTVGSDRFDALPEKTRAARRAEGPALLADVDPILTAGAPFDPARIDTPCVFGAGIRDTAPYASGATWLADHIENARIELVSGSTHGAPMSDPTMVASMIRSVARQGDAPIHETGDHDAITV